MTRDLNKRKTIKIQVSSNLKNNDKLKEALVKKLGEELILLSDLSWLPKKDLTSSNM